MLDRERKGKKVHTKRNLRVTVQQWRKKEGKGRKDKKRCQ